MQQINIAMSEKKEHNKKSFRMPYGQICLWSIVAMAVTFPFSYTLFWVAVIVLIISFSLGICQASDSTDDGLPWFYGGGLF